MAQSFNEFEIVRIVEESDVIKSFYLRSKSPLPREYIPGEYLVFQLEGANFENERREYSISGHEGDLLRVTVKHEKAPEPGLPDGLYSTYFHETLALGDCIKAAGPMGKFLLDSKSTKPVVLLSGGVGITPMMAMAYQLAGEEARSVTFIHACDNGAVHAMAGEVRDLASKYDNFSSTTFYRTPLESDKPVVDYDVKGLVKGDVFQALVSDMDRDFYLCGPTPFMQSMYQMLSELGVDDRQIKYEFFGPATVLKQNSLIPSDKSDERIDLNVPLVTFKKSGISRSWDIEFDNLLEFAEEHDVLVDFSCRAGSCDTCKTRILSGNVHYEQEPVERPDANHVLMCCSVPDENIELDI